MIFLVTVGAVIVFWISLMFKPTVMIWVKLFMISLHIIKWAIIVGLITAFLSMPQLYSYMGWTPLSLLFGNKIYQSSVKM